MGRWIKVDEMVVLKGDPRVKRLARALSCSYGDAVFALMCVWRALYFVTHGGPMSAEDIDEAAELAGMAAAMAACGLAEETPDGYQIAGARHAASAAAFFKSKSENRKKRNDGDQTPTKPERVENEKQTRRERATSTSKSSSTVSLFSETEEATETVEASSPRARKPRPFEALAQQLWVEQERMRAALGRGLRPLRYDEDRAKRIEARLEDGASEDDCRHVLAVYAAEARRNPEAAKWFNGETNWIAKNFKRALGQPVPSGAARASPVTATEMADYARRLADEERDEHDPR